MTAPAPGAGASPPLVGCAAQACGRPRSEDFFGVALPTDDSEAARGVVVALADGVSAPNGAGRAAAEAAVRAAVSDYFCTPAAWSNAVALERVIGATNAWCHAKNTGGGESAGLMCTLSVLVLHREGFEVAHVGDSRIYHVSDGRALRLTTDHVWPRRDMQRVLKRAVGLDESILIQFERGEFAPGDRFALVSDGVWDVLGEARLGEILVAEAQPQPAADALVAEAVALGAKYFGRNDASALVVVPA